MKTVKYNVKFKREYRRKVTLFSMSRLFTETISETNSIHLDTFLCRHYGLQVSLSRHVINLSQLEA